MCGISKGIQNTNLGVFLHGSPENIFATLSALVDHYTNHWSADTDIYTLPCPLKLVASFKDAEEMFQNELLRGGGGGADDSVDKMSWPELELKSCLRATPVDFSKSKGGGRLFGKRKAAIRWNEDELTRIQHELAPFHGIRKRIDPVASRATYMMPDLQLGEVNDVLAAAPCGRFVIYSAADGGVESLRLSYVNSSGKINHTNIKNVKRGIRLEKSKTLFRSVTKLVNYYSSQNPELPRMLAQQKGGGQLSGVSWLRPTMNRLQATELLSMAPSGSFVVRSGSSGSSGRPGSKPGSGRGAHGADGGSRNYVMTYVHAGTIHHTFVSELKSGKLAINGADQSFDSIFDLVQYYCSVKKTKDLRCPLRLPRQGEDERHAWLRTGIPKDDALQVLYDQSEGAFVVRTKGQC